MSLVKSLEREEDEERRSKYMSLRRKRMAVLLPSSQHVLKRSVPPESTVGYEARMLYQNTRKITALKSNQPFCHYKYIL